MAKLTQDWTYRTATTTIDFRAGQKPTGDALAAAIAAGVIEEEKEQDNADTRKPVAARKARAADTSEG